MKLYRYWLVCLVVLGACALDTELTTPDPLLGDRSAIIGGTVTEGRPEVTILQLQAGLCSGTLIDEEIVLTAAHCVADQVISGRTDLGSVVFGSGFGDPEAQTIGIRDMAMHRRYNINQLGLGLPFDIAAVRLEQPAPDGVRPAIFNNIPLDRDALPGTTVLAVGFGVSDASTGTGVGTKRQAFLPIADVLSNRFRVGNQTVTTCSGDSGGPGFLVVDGIERIVGITSTGPIGCDGVSTMNRVDTYVEDFLYIAVDAWSGPCSADADQICNMDCPRTPDPDCDPCGFDGTCAEGCPNIDFDCPIGGFSGDPCERDNDCESRLCVAAPEDGRVKYCSDRCDPGEDPAFECENPLTVCRPDGDQGACVFGGITPRVLGADCNTGSQCRAGVCDLDNNVCAEPCETGADCGEGFECRRLDGDRVCRVPAAGGCAAAGGLGGAGATGFFAVALVVVARRRRRRT